MSTTPEYTKRAIKNYNSKFDRVAINLPKGTRERIQELTGLSCNAYLNKLAEADLSKLERKHEKEADDNPPF